MDPWSAFAKAIVYPVVRAMADAWFDAMVRYNVNVEEIANELDKERAARFRTAVRERVQSLTPTKGNPVLPNSTPSIPGDGRVDLREIARRILDRGTDPPAQGVVDSKP
jgi:3'-phosphoadenosine 5'-phosphosulfate sulfotransferase